MIMKQHFKSMTQSDLSTVRQDQYPMSLVEAELEKLCIEGIIEPVSFSEWAVPIVKPDRKSIRICGDFKLTINQASQLDRYSIPNVEDLLATLAGEQKFTKLNPS